MRNIVAYIKEKLKRNFNEAIIKNSDLSILENDIRLYTEKITKEVLKSFLEDYDEMLKLDENRDSRYVVQRKSGKNVISTLGTFKIERTKYYDKVDKRYFYMLDERLNIPSYERFTPYALSKMIKEAANTSYKRAGEEINNFDIISKGTVYNKIKKLEVKEEYKEKEQKRKVKVLYINIDEDHISLQKAKERSVLGKIAYIYEGTIKECKNRYRLTYKHTICGTYEKTSGNRAFYENINRYIECNYDTKYLDKIIVYGDGASYIKASMEYMPKSEFRIDKFHLSKYISQASFTIIGNRHILKKDIYKCLYEEDKEKFIDLMDDAIYSSNNIKVIKDTKDYILNNWDAINRTIFAKEGNCSAEGNVSHTLSVRMSQKGLGWSKHNADQICKLRGIQSNYGESIFIDIVNEYYKNRMFYIDKDKRNNNEYYRECIIDKTNDKRYIEQIQVSIPDQLAKRIGILGADLHLN